MFKLAFKSRQRKCIVNTQPKSAGWPAPLTASVFNRLGQRANSPGSRAYRYVKLAVSSLAVAVSIASTHYAYPRRDGQAELAWVTVTWVRVNPITPSACTNSPPTNLSL